MHVSEGHIYDFTFYTTIDGGIKTSRFAIDTTDLMGDMCRVLFVDDIYSDAPTAMFLIPREKLLEMLHLMVANDY